MIVRDLKGLGLMVSRTADESRAFVSAGVQALPTTFKGDLEDVTFNVQTPSTTLETFVQILTKKFVVPRTADPKLVEVVGVRG